MRLVLVNVTTPDKRSLVPLGFRLLKGYDEEMPIYGICLDERIHAT
jgi:hypothetical protein